MCKICFRVAMSSIEPAHFPNQINKGRQLNSQKHGRGCGLVNAKKYHYDVKTAFYPPLVYLFLSYNWVSTSRRQIVPEWPPVTCKLYPCVAASCMQISADFIHVTCDWRPRCYNLHLTYLLGLLGGWSPLVPLGPLWRCSCSVLPPPFASRQSRKSVKRVQSYYLCAFCRHF